MSLVGRCILLGACLGLVALLLACGGSGASSDGLLSAPARTRPDDKIVVAPGKPIVIGSSEPLTGPDGAGGLEDRDAVIAALNLWKQQNGERLKGHDVVVRAEDDGCTRADQAVLAANRFLRTPGLVGVIGPGCSPGAKAAIPIYTAAGISTISGSATESGLTSTGTTFFRTAYRNDLQGAIIGLFVGQQLRAKKAYVVDDSESYGQDLAESARKSLEENGVRVVRMSVQRGAADFASEAKRVTEDHPDFVVFAGFNPEAALFYRQLRDAGYAGDFGGTDAAAVERSFIAPVSARLAEGVYFSGCSPRLPEAFARAFKAVHGAAPDSSAFTPHVADATRILLDAVAQVAELQPDGSLVVDPARLRAVVAGTRLSDGVSGRVAFDARGDRTTSGSDIRAEALDTGWTGCQVHGGHFEILFP